jgi:hypothetical protein
MRFPLIIGSELLVYLRPRLISARLKGVP